MSNREAFFPDGRYAVEVTAVSHGSRESGTMILPVDDLAGSTTETQGIIVDNHLPGIGAVIIYSSNSTGSPSSIDIKYVAKWIQKSDLDTPEYMEQLAYLEELREDLRFFRLLERSDAVSALEIFRINSDLQNESVHFCPALSRIPISTEIRNNGSNSVPCEVEDWGAVEDVGRDPVEYLQEEIAKVEDELDSRAGTRNLKVGEYGYIPYRGASSADGETLNMLVIYSEPTMVENFSGIPLTDVIRMEGAIGYEILWDSQESGGMFVRDTPAGNAEHTGLLQEQMGSGFPSAPDAEYAAHYTYQGNLPLEFCGLIQVFIGADTLSTTKGPRDLAGHRIDIGQYTIPATRYGYESWAYVGSTHPGYRPGIDASYIWGRPIWWFIDGIASAHVGGDVIAELEIASLGFEGAYSCIGNCFFEFGFWVYDDEYGECDFDIAIVRPDGSVLHHVFNTKFPKGTTSNNQFWWGGPCYGPFGGSEYTVSRDTRYFWMAGGHASISYSESDASATSNAYAYCVDSKTGIMRSYCVAFGFSSTHDESDIEGPTLAYAQICKIYKSGEALVMHANPGGDYHYTVIHPLGGGADSIEELSSAEQCNASVTVEKASSCNVLSNPVTESLDVVVSGGLGENWNLAVFDLSGRCVISESGVCTEGNSVLNFGTAGLPSGIYMLRVEVGEVEELRSISIVH